MSDLFAATGAEIKLRDYQLAAIESVRNAIREGHKNIILCAPTGSGKTVLAAHLINESSRKLRRSAFVVDRITLVNQTSETFDRYGIDHGIVQASNPRYQPWKRVQICSAQTLVMRDWPEADLIVVDEAHALTKIVSDKIKPRDVVTIGLTATPFSKGLGKIYDALVNVTTTNKLIADGFLSDYRIYSAVEPDMEGVRIVAGEFEEKETSKRALQVVGDVVAEYLKHGEGRKFIACSVDVNHAEEMARQFNSAGIRAAAYTYKTSDDEREGLVQEFRKTDSRIRGLISPVALTKGFDCIAEGSLILTQRGHVAIEKLLLSDRIWDGTEFVSHSGAIFKGERNVITYAGLTATADHFVKTADGWKKFGDCARDGIKIVKTADAGRPIPERDGNFAGGTCQSQDKSSGISLSMLRLWERIKDSSLRIADSAMGWMFGMRYTTLAYSTMQGGDVSLPASTASGISKLRRAWNRISLPITARSGNMDCAESWVEKTRSVDSIGQNRQQRPLRTGQSSVGIKTSECMQHPARWMGGENASIQDGISRDSIRGQDIEKPIFHGDGQVRDSREVSQTIGQTKRRVWDVLNAGPRNCFTCEGLLVHNCPDVSCLIMARPLRNSLAEHVQFFGRGLRIHPDKADCVILDHSGNCRRFSDEWTTFFETGALELDDGKPKPKTAKKPTENPSMVKCPQCTRLHPPMPRCPACGHEYPRKQTVQHVDGTLTEWIANGDRKRLDHDVWPQVCAYVRSKVYDVDLGRRMAQAMMIQITGHFARANYADTTPAKRITPEVMELIHASNRAYQKSKRDAKKAVQRASAPAPKVDDGTEPPW